MINTDKPAALSFTNITRVSHAETWATSTESWDSEARTYLQAGSFVSNVDKASNLVLVPEHTTNVASLIRTPTGFFNNVGYVDANYSGYKFVNYARVESTIKTVTLWSNGVVGNPTGDIIVKINSMATVYGTGTHTAAEWIAASGGEITFDIVMSRIPTGSRLEMTVDSTANETAGNTFSIGYCYSGIKDDGTTVVYKIKKNLSAQALVGTYPNGFFSAVQSTPAYYAQTFTNSAKPV